MSSRRSGSRLKILQDLHEQICVCTACRLRRGRTHAVPGEGDIGADIMLIGEAPGAREDLQGRPFVGPAGRFLDQLLADNRLERGRVFITSAVKCRPPDNRTPKDDELNTCRRLWLERQIELVDPDLIVLMGKTPLRQLFGEKNAKLSEIHGEIRRKDGRRYLLTYHPAAGMRFPVARRAMEEDFRGLSGV